MATSKTEWTDEAHDDGYREAIQRNAEGVALYRIRWDDGPAGVQSRTDSEIPETGITTHWQSFFKDGSRRYVSVRVGDTITTTEFYPASNLGPDDPKFNALEPFQWGGEEGSKLSVVVYDLQGRPDGTMEVFTRNESVLFRGIVRDGLRASGFAFFHPNGEVAAEIVQPSPVVWRYFSPTGALLSEADFEADYGYLHSWIAASENRSVWTSLVFGEPDRPAYRESVQVG